MERPDVRATGGCLCGRVQYEVVGELMPVINCHCGKCRRFHGHVGAYSATRRENLVLVEAASLKWYRSIQDETPDAHRGFCRECGSSLFWDPRGKPYIAVAAGSINPPTGLETERHVWLSQKADYYTLTDGLPWHDEGFGREDSAKDQPQT